MAKKLILVTSGEPSGIGPDICLQLAKYPLSSEYMLVILGDIELLEKRAHMLHMASEICLHKVSINELTNLIAEPSCNDQVPRTQPSNLTKFRSDGSTHKLHVLHIPCPDHACIGALKTANAKYVLSLLDTAINICTAGLTNTIVTAPISKENICNYGVAFSGHTEYLAQAFGCDKVVMMLANSKLKVALLTTHLPLKEVPAQITRENLNRTIEIILTTFKEQYGITNPRIGVCGLNPHAGEGGHLGDEELTIINPVIEAWQKQGYLVSGSYPADTIFNQAHQFDVILAMYHDQGLPALKYSGFNEGINVTLGLPIIRTSVDHGTALPLAGTGKADPSSLYKAVEFAVKVPHKFITNQNKKYYKS